MRTTDVAEAMQYLASQNVHSVDELEKLPDGYHWVQDPAGTVFVLSKKDKTYSI